MRWLELAVTLGALGASAVLGCSRQVDEAGDRGQDGACEDDAEEETPATNDVLADMGCEQGTHDVLSLSFSLRGTFDCRVVGYETFAGGEYVTLLCGDALLGEELVHEAMLYANSETEALLLKQLVEGQLYRISRDMWLTVQAQSGEVLVARLADAFDLPISGRLEYAPPVGFPDLELAFVQQDCGPIQGGCTGEGTPGVVELRIGTEQGEVVHQGRGVVGDYDVHVGAAWFDSWDGDWYCDFPVSQLNVVLARRPP